MSNKEKDMATVKPKDFKDLSAEELYRSAVEDFALPVDEDDKESKKVLLAAFVEGGVVFDDYIEQHPEVGPDDDEKAEVSTNRQTERTREGDVITTRTEQKGLSVSEEVPVNIAGKWADDERSQANLTVEEPRIHVKEEMVINPQDKFLIKMTRDNPLFEVRGYRFTSAHPYALVAAEDAQYILEKQDGFRQAFPNELQEFYG